tara:strand:- start:287 stop:763 length:477 start_codon:yes stop_codon:yes gene_type:complete
MISINVYEIVMQIINFCILWFLITKFLVKPLGIFLQNRSDSIKNDIDVASQNKTESEKLLKSQKDAYNEARQEIKKMRQEAEDNVNEERLKVIDQAKLDSAKIIADANKTVALNLEEVKRSLLSETTHLVVGMAKKVLKREITKTDQQMLVSEALGQK